MLSYTTTYYHNYAEGEAAIIDGCMVWYFLLLHALSIWTAANNNPRPMNLFRLQVWLIVDNNDSDSIISPRS